MEIKELIKLIAQKHRSYGIDINPPATILDINNFEKCLGFALPTDFKEFYLTCNGFGCTEDIFNMVPLHDILQYQKDYGVSWFYFSEYMIYSDMWGLRLRLSGEYEIFNGSFPEKTMTSSLTEFLKVFLKGNVFDSGGLYQWQEKLGINDR
jgi:hypothetical protein